MFTTYTTNLLDEVDVLMLLVCINVLLHAAAKKHKIAQKRYSTTD
jgi:hypothetical protein